MAGYDSNIGLGGVHNHYGPRTTDGVRGVAPSDSLERQYTIEVGAANVLTDPGVIPAGSIVTGVYAPAAVTAVTVGGTAVTAATEAAPVQITTAGAPVLTGGAAGDIVIVKYLHTGVSTGVIVP